MVSRTTRTVADREGGPFDTAVHEVFTQSTIGISTGQVGMAGYTPQQWGSGGAHAFQLSRVNDGSFAFMESAIDDPWDIPFTDGTAETALTVEFVVTAPTLLHVFAWMGYGGSATATFSLHLDGVEVVGTDDFPVVIVNPWRSERQGFVDITLAPGNYLFEVTASGGFLGGHNHQRTGATGAIHGQLLFSPLPVGLIPAPGSLALLGAAGFLAAARRERPPN